MNYFINNQDLLIDELIKDSVYNFIHRDKIIDINYFNDKVIINCQDIDQIVIDYNDIMLGYNTINSDESDYFLDVYILIQILARSYYRKYRKDIIHSDSFFTREYISYPSFTLEELIILKANITRGKILYDMIPTITWCLKRKTSNNYYKEFYLKLPDNSVSQIKEILIRIQNDMKNIYVSCNQLIKYPFTNNSYYGASIFTGGSIMRTMYDRNCSDKRSKISPLSSGKEILKTLYCLAWLCGLREVKRTDMSTLPSCNASLIIIRLAAGLDALGMNDGFFIPDQEQYILYSDIKEKLGSDNELVFLANEFMIHRNDIRKQREICKSIDFIIKERYEQENTILSEINFVRKIVITDIFNWIDNWVPDFPPKLLDIIIYLYNKDNLL